MAKVTSVERERCVGTLRAYLDEGGEIHTLTTLGRGETDYVRLFVVTSKRRIADVTYYAATAFGDAKITPQGWPFRGAQYNKGLEAADCAWRAAYGEALPQERHVWHEL